MLLTPDQLVERFSNAGSILNPADFALALENYNYYAPQILSYPRPRAGSEGDDQPIAEAFKTLSLANQFQTSGSYSWFVDSINAPPSGLDRIFSQGPTLIASAFLPLTAAHAAAVGAPTLWQAVGQAFSGISDAVTGAFSGAPVPDLPPLDLADVPVEGSGFPGDPGNIPGSGPPAPPQTFDGGWSPSLDVPQVPVPSAPSSPVNVPAAPAPAVSALRSLLAPLIGGGALSLAGSGGSASGGSAAPGFGQSAGGPVQLAPAASGGGVMLALAALGVVGLVVVKKLRK